PTFPAARPRAGKRASPTSREKAAAEGRLVAIVVSFLLVPRSDEAGVTTGLAGVISPAPTGTGNAPTSRSGGPSARGGAAPRAGPPRSRSSDPRSSAPPATSTGRPGAGSRPRSPGGVVHEELHFGVVT